MKPENILYDSASNRLVVADFGIAHFEEDELLTAVETKDQERLANFTYAAPEQHVRGSEVGPRADIFALGLMLNEMFTRSVPLGQGHPLVASVSPAHAYLDEIVARMIQHSPADRYQTIGKIKEDLVARQQTFVALQKLDDLRKQVVPAATPDDPLGGAELSIVKFEYEPDRRDQNRGELILMFNVHPPTDWQYCFQQQTAPNIMGSAHPTFVHFYPRRQASIVMPESMVEQVVPLLKTWTSSANKLYREHLTKVAEEEHRARLPALQREQAIAEEKARVTERISKLL